MNKTAYNILRWGLGITFIWIGVLILKNPLGWGAFIQPWAVPYLPAPLETMMTQTGYLDIITGLIMFINPVVWIGALVGTIHLIIVLITCGITDITVRDIGLTVATMSLFIETMPAFIRAWIKI